MNNFGDILIWLALFALFVSSAGYLVLCRKKEHKAALMAARIGFVSFAAFMTIASIHLMILILNHDFTYSYIVQYSSRDLSLEYLISSFWAGQEGSFLVWVLFGAWLGLLLMFRARKMEQHVMLIYNLNNIFLTILLIKQSPFSRKKKRPREMIRNASMKKTSEPVMPRSANECTEKSAKTPDLVKKVQYIIRIKEKTANMKFVLYNFLRLFCKTMPCISAMINSHGRRDAFSTGSQPQYPPHPSTL
jgi:hypothetical protein